MLSLADDRRPSPVYHTDRPSRLTASDAMDVQLRNISKSRVWLKFLKEVSLFLEISEAKTRRHGG